MILPSSQVGRIPPNRLDRAFFANLREHPSWRGLKIFRQQVFGRKRRPIMALSPILTLGAPIDDDATRYENYGER